MPAAPTKMKMFGSFSRLVSILFRKNGYDQTLLPNQSISYTADRVIELPEVDLDCVLISEAQVADGYQPLNNRLTEVTQLGVGLIVSDPANDGVLARTIESSANNGLAVENGDGVAGNPAIGLDLANLEAAGGDAVFADSMIFGDLSDGLRAKSMTIQELSDLIVPSPVVSGKYFSWSEGNTKTCVHNFGTKIVMVQIFDYDGRTVYVDDVLRTDNNTVDLSAVGFDNPPGGDWTVLITSGAGFVAG